MTHLGFERISDLAELPVSAVSTTDARHLSECATCREQLRRMRELLSVARQLPREETPPAEVWGSIAKRIRGASTGSASQSSSSPARRSWRAGPFVAIAATIVIVVGATLLMPSDGASRKKIPASSPATVSAAVATVERQYDPVVAQLRGALEEQRRDLRGSTINVVERSLAAIDTAIAEARTALGSDPGNQTLVEILSSHYERKVDLLQRATELDPSS